MHKEIYVKMQKTRLSIILLSILSLILIPIVVQAATITVCTLDKDVYHQGETGFIRVTVYNDKDNKIRVTEITATIDYFYTDKTMYVQTFFTNATLPVEIQVGQSSTFYVPFSLPTNIASGYTKLYVKAKTELWNTASERWFMSDHPTYQPLLYIESPYKQQFEQSQERLQQLQMINNNVTIMMYIFGAATILFALIMVFLLILNRRTGVISSPSA